MRDKSRLSKKLCILAMACFVPTASTWGYLPAANAAAKTAPDTGDNSSTNAGANTPETNKFTEDAWQQLAAKPQPTEKLMNKLAAAIQKEKQNYQAHYLLGICYQRMGLPDEAIAEFKLAVQYGPNAADPMIRLIRQAVDAGQIDLASQVADIAIGRFPNNPEIGFWQGNFMMLKMHKLPEADMLFERVRKSKVFIPNLNLSLATLRLAQNRVDDALALAKYQLMLTPQAPGANLIIGQIYFRKRDYTRAYRFLKPAYESLVFTPKLAQAYMQAAYWTGHFQDCLEPAIVQMALSSTKNNDDPNAKQIFHDASMRVPKAKVKEIVTNSSATLDSFGRHLPDPASFHRTLAESLSTIGLHDLAAHEYERCLKGDPTDGAADFLLARELELYLGKYDEALEYYLLAQQHNAPVHNIDLYIEHLKSRMNCRNADLAWQLKDYLHQAVGAN